MSVGDEFVLCGGGAECIGVGHGVKEGQVLVSFSSGAVQVYDVSHPSLLNSSSSSFVPLTSHLLYPFSS